MESYLFLAATTLSGLEISDKKDRSSLTTFFDGDFDGETSLDFFSIFLKQLQNKRNPGEIAKTNLAHSLKNLSTPIIGT